MTIWNSPQWKLFIGAASPIVYLCVGSKAQSFVLLAIHVKDFFFFRFRFCIFFSVCIFSFFFSQSRLSILRSSLSSKEGGEGEGGGRMEKLQESDKVSKMSR